MRVTFVSNYINHHQIPVSAVLYEKWKEDYCFIQTEPMEEERIRMGWNADTEELPFLKQYHKEPEQCRMLISESDVVIFGGTDEESYIQERLASGKPVIRYSERQYKEGQWKAISPRGLRKKYLDHTRYRNAPVYLLCAGAYVAHDFDIVKAYRGKRFKWGYFPAFESCSAEDLNSLRTVEGRVDILWAGRFLDWKHPEDALEVAKYLKEKRYDFRLRVAGGGEREAALKTYVKEHGLEEFVEFMGFCKPEEVRRLMKQSHIYLFTSDYKEGWGAVLNEAMNSGCAVVASHAIGAVPYLLEHNKNGLIYKSGNISELCQCAETLCKQKQYREQLGLAAYETIQKEWNPEIAANRLIALCEAVAAGKAIFFNEGPLSEAKVVKQSKMYRYLVKESVKE